MKKIFLALMLGLTSFGISAQASASARLDSMAADSREVDDIDLIWLYPNKVLDYKNTVDLRLASDGDFGDGTNEWGGVISEIDPDLGTWGVYVNRPLIEESSLLPTFGGFFNSYPIVPLPILGINQAPTGSLLLALFEPDTRNIVDAFWAKNLGGADLGIRLIYGSAFPNLDNLGLSVGLGLTNVGPFSQLNFHADYTVVDLNSAVIGFKNDGIFTIKEGVLASSDLDQVDTLKVFLDLKQDEFKIETIPVILDLSDFGSDLGLSLNRKIQGGKGLISTGLIFDYFGMSAPNGLFPVAPPFKIDTWILLWNASMEYQVYDWLTLRAGLAKALVARAYDSEDIAGNGTYYDGTGSPVVFNLGFGINWQNFTLDANVNAGSLENSINNTQPGHGLFFNNGEPIAQVVSADLKYKF